MHTLNYTYTQTFMRIDTYIHTHSHCGYAMFSMDQDPYFTPAEAKPSRGSCRGPSCSTREAFCSVRGFSHSFSHFSHHWECALGDTGMQPCDNRSVHPFEGYKVTPEVLPHPSRDGQRTWGFSGLCSPAQTLLFLTFSP